MLADACSGDSCGPRQRFSAILISSLPFIVSFALVVTFVSQRLWPLLSGSYGKDIDIGSPLSPLASRLPTHNYELNQSQSRSSITKPSARRLAGFTFSTNIALSAVLVELILCDISNALNPAARSLVLKVTLPSLLFLLILVAPALELHSLISAAGWNFSGSRKTRLRPAWVIEIAGLACWLWLFWYLGKALLGLYLEEETYMRRHSFSEGCLERIGIIGIALMALLSGFAAVSAVWHTLATKQRPVRFPPPFGNLKDELTNQPFRSPKQTSPAKPPASPQPTTCSSPSAPACAPCSASSQKPPVPRASWAA